MVRCSRERLERQLQGQGKARGGVGGKRGCTLAASGGGDLRYS